MTDERTDLLRLCKMKMAGVQVSVQDLILSQAVTVFAMSIAMVMGPTPPGTGVMTEHFGATVSKSTSPTRR